MLGRAVCHSGQCGTNCPGEKVDLTTTSAPKYVQVGDERVGNEEKIDNTEAENNEAPTEE